MQAPKNQQINFDIDLITISLPDAHVTATTVFEERIIFFTLENDFRLHFKFLDS